MPVKQCKPCNIALSLQPRESRGIHEEKIWLEPRGIQEDQQNGQRERLDRMRLLREISEAETRFETVLR